MISFAAEILGQIGLVVSDSAPQFVLEFSEHESRTCMLPKQGGDTVFEDILDLLGDVIRSGMLAVEAQRNKGGATLLVVQSSSIVGFATSSSTVGERVFVRVHPKVGTGRMLELAVLAEMLPNWKLGGADISPSIEEALLEWTLGAFDEGLRRLLVKGGLRHTHERIRAELQNRVRGRLLPGPWLRNVAKGKPNVLPAEFPSLEFDNPANRLLRWATQVGIAVAQSMPRTKGIAERLRQKDRQFAGVTLAKPRGPMLNTNGLPTNLRHYAESLSLARQVIDSVRLGIRPGEVEAMSIAIDMNDVYERAFFNGLMTHQPEASRHETWKIHYSAAVPVEEGKHARSTEMIPDVWIQGTQGRLPIVVDTKWKNLLFKRGPVDLGDLLSAEETKTIKLRPEDLYQATAYAVEALQRRLADGHPCDGCVAALVYPTTRPIPDYGREVRLGPFRIIIRIVAWNVTAPPLVEIGKIWERLNILATGVPLETQPTDG
jgi:5-methylcytosine-specific restriction endonuclease McrBC regulatory subunit McrC